MQLYMARSTKNRTEGFFRKRTVTTYVLRIRLELEAEEKVALYQHRKLLYSRAFRWSTGGEKEDVMIMELVEAPYMDCEVIEMARILSIEQQLEETAEAIKQLIAPILGMVPDLEVVRQV